jgi:hypothetical protein
VYTDSVLGVVTPSVECVRVGEEEQSAVGEGEGEGERGSKGDLPAHSRNECLFVGAADLVSSVPRDSLGLSPPTVDSTR